MEPRDLYGLPLEQFTSERNALVRELRRGGQRDAAAEASRLRKPSVGAWAVNQLVRTQSRAVAELFSAGDDLRKAQAELLAGRSDADSLRRAVESERSAVDRLVQRARGLLTSDGHQLSPATIEQVSETLHAAAIDEQARARVRDGCLDRELRHVGLAAFPGSARERSGRASLQSSPKRSTEEARERRAQRSTARRAEAQARRQLERAMRAVADAEERHHRAQREVQEAEAALESARETHKQAMRAHERAREALDGLT